MLMPDPTDKADGRGHDCEGGILRLSISVCHGEGKSGLQTRNATTKPHCQQIFKNGKLGRVRWMTR